MECLILIPLLYVVLKGFIVLWNKGLDEEYESAQYRASIMLGLGQREDARILMENAMLDYKRSKIRIKL